MLYSDLREAKAILEIDPDNTEEDIRLLIWLEQVSSWIEELLGRDFSFKARTQYYDGTGTQRMLLKNRPVYPTTNPYPTTYPGFQPIQVTVDNSGYYGAASGSFTNTPLTYGAENGYALRIDQDDGSSRSAVLIRSNQYWDRPFARQAGLLTPFRIQAMGNIQVIYTAGYTVDSLPGVFRLACDQILAQVRWIFPVGVPLGSQSYEDRSVSELAERRDYLLAMIKPMLWGFRNWSF